MQRAMIACADLPPSVRAPIPETGYTDTYDVQRGSEWRLSVLAVDAAVRKQQGVLTARCVVVRLPGVKAGNFDRLGRQ
jgi:hypothetical protein